MTDTGRGHPVDRAPAPWPEVAANDPLAETARRFVLNLRAAIGTRSVRAVAGDAGVSHVTLLRVLAGKVWPDLATITRLEMALDADLHSSREVRRTTHSSEDID